MAVLEIATNRSCVLRSVLFTGLLPLVLVLCVPDSVVYAERNEFGVKAAFRDATQQAARSTVSVLCDGRTGAMGTIIASDGYIVTKASELQGSIVCRVHGLATRLDAELVGVKEEYDLALLRVKAKNLPVISWCDEEPPQVGSWVATPGMDSVPLAIGVVSVESQKIEPRIAALGVVIKDTRGDRGARVVDIVPGSGADRARIEQGDVITHLAGRRVTSRDELVAAVRDLVPGDRVRVRALRGDTAIDVVATLNDLNELGTQSRDTVPESFGGQLSKRRAGFPLVIQHDTVLEPEQCGGPLVNLDGEAVGINIARASRIASYALPAEAVKSAIRQLVAERLTARTTAPVSPSGSPPAAGETAAVR